MDLRFKRKTYNPNCYRRYGQYGKWYPHYSADLMDSMSFGFKIGHVFARFSKKDEKMASLLQNPDVIKGAPANDRPANNMKMYVFFMLFLKPPISYINLEP